jgi:hypothetical protein
MQQEHLAVSDVGESRLLAIANDFVKGVPDLSEADLGVLTLQAWVFLTDERCVPSQWSVGLCLYNGTA